MNRLHLCSIPIFVALYYPCVSAAAEGRSRLDAFLADFSTLEAKFQQTVVDEKGRQLETSSGDVFLQRPGKFRWEYKAPYEQSIVADGERVWIYDVDLEQVSVKPMDSALADTPSLLLGGYASVDEEFSVVELGEADRLVWVGLTPKRKDNQYSTIRLGFNGKEMQVMELADAFGQTTRIVFSAQKRNKGIQSSIFQFVPPPGVDVLDASSDL